MRPTMLMRVLSAAVVCTAFLAGAHNAVAQTQQLNKTLERKFPSGLCPIPTVEIGSFITATGHIKLTFITPNGYDLQGQFIHHQQTLDNISIITEAEFNTLAADPNNTHESCYFDGFVTTLPPALLAGNPNVAYLEQFDPPSGLCAWDESDGATINGGVIELGSFADGLVDVSTSVIISGLTPNVPYVIHGDWSADEFNIFLNCTGAGICMNITVDDLPNGCGPLAVESTTWGAVKALYKN